MTIITDKVKMLMVSIDNLNYENKQHKELNKELLTLLSEIKICLDSGVEINSTSLFHSQINLLIDKYVSLT